MTLSSHGSRCYNGPLRSYVHPLITCEKSDLQVEASSLDIEDAPPRQAPFSQGYEVAAAPAPEIHSKGVVATDITGFFRTAAQRKLPDNQFPSHC